MTELRPFVAWDGEGVKGDDDYHPYSLFGSSLGGRVKGYNLSTLECFTLMMDTERSCPEAIHFGFAFGYDVNMIIKDFPMPQLIMLKKRTATRWNNFSVEYIPRKWISVGYGKGRGRTYLRIFDVFSFFGKGLGPTLRQYKIGSESELERIERGKGERPNFTYDDIPTSIEPYWETELSLMVRLMDQFRDILYGAGLYINSWHGPGAIAAYLLRKHNVQNLMDRGISAEILEAARYAYFGGRFEPFSAGFYEGPIYSADINSAYPYSHSRLPSLQDGKWLHELGRPGLNPRDTRLGMYRIRYHAPYSGKAMPLPHRDNDGSVRFSNATEGWFHAAEAYMVYNDPHAEFLEAWIFEDDGSYPFAWINDLYEQRLELQAVGDPTQIAFKLGPNSLYGSVARRAGWEKTGGPPKWHQLEWAGAITSECRSMVFSAARSVGTNLISIDTDGVLSTIPFRKLPNGEGNKLGQWKVEQYTGMLYIQNGIYWLRGNDGIWLPPKSRGIPRKKLNFEEIWPVISSGQDITVNQHMFIGFGLALRGRMHDWRKWLDSPRTINFGGTGKRVHSSAACNGCRNGFSYTDGLHTLIPVPPRSIMSTPHFLPWLHKPTESSEGWPDLGTELVVRERLMNEEKWGVFE